MQWHIYLRICISGIISYLIIAPFLLFQTLNINYVISFINCNDINATDKNHCVKFNNKQFVSLLLELGANPNVCDYKLGETPMHISIRENKSEIFNTFIEWNLGITKRIISRKKKIKLNQCFVIGIVKIMNYHTTQLNPMKLLYSIRIINYF